MGIQISRQVLVPEHKYTYPGWAILVFVVAFPALGQDVKRHANRPTGKLPLAKTPFNAAAAHQHQKACAEHLGAAVETTNSIGMKFVLIPPGRFLMGSAESAEAVAKKFHTKADNFTDEHPQHSVVITNPFYVGKYEVTVAQFRQFVESRGFATEAELDRQESFGWNDKEDKFEIVSDGRSWFMTSKGKKEETQRTGSPPYTWRNAGWKQKDSHPVVSVSWNDATAFCDWLSRKEGRTYRLPTEAEWEYACRAGTQTRFFNGNDGKKLADVCNAWDLTAKDAMTNYQDLEYMDSRDGHVFSAPVGRFGANGFGLHDMLGNVFEWCQDFYGERYYSESTAKDPKGPVASPYRIARGGGWFNLAWGCRSADRHGFEPMFRSFNLGFRLVLLPPKLQR